MSESARPGRAGESGSSGALSRADLHSTEASRSAAPSRSAARSRSAEPARSGEPSRSVGLSRTSAQARPRAPALSLLRCQAGPYPLLLDVGALVTVDRPAERPADSGLRVIDLRALLGAPTGPAQSLVFVLRAGDDPIEVLVDVGVELLRVDPDGLHPWPFPLDLASHVPGLSGLVQLDEDQLAFLLDPHRLV